jgi:outer membrane protein OmpA-like peptidoglycan-associated protein
MIQKANTAFKSENYALAADLCSDAYMKLSKNKKKKGDMAYKTALCYRYTEKYKEAHEWFNRAVLLDYQEIEPQVLLHNADMLVMMTECEKAIENYEAYLALVPGDDRAKIGIESCKSAKAFEAERTRHIVENIETINVEEFDMAPMMGDRRMSKMYYSSSRDGSTGKAQDPRSGEGYMDIWMTELDKKGNWKEPKLLVGENINTIDNEGTVAFDSRFKKMFFTRCPNKKKSNLGCDIWVSEAKGKEEWKEPMKIEGLKSHDSVSVGHPCTMDGRYLIFASDMAGGFGGRDLWYTRYDRKAETWSAPKNMGPEINTKGNELFPTFALNGDLMFASDGRPGMGGLDIFRAKRIGDSEDFTDPKWENPQNIGSPINSTGNDYAIVEIDDRHGVFTSERKSRNGEYVPDLYSYELPPNLFTLKVIVSELGNTDVKIEDVKVTVKGNDGKAIPVGFTMDDGSYFWEKSPASGDRYINEEADYTITISKEGYHEDKKGSSFSTKGTETGKDFVIDMALLPKTPIRLPEVRYPLDRWELLVDSTINSPDSLQFVYDLLDEYPNMVLELSSHTDARGKDARNQKLSENRARACYIYLVKEKGVDPRRIVPVGKGEVEPRKVWRKDGKYLVVKPVDMTGVEELILKEEYINEYKSKDPQMFKLLHQFNRRTEGRVLNMDFDPATAPAADPKLLEYIPYP